MELSELREWVTLIFSGVVLPLIYVFRSARNKILTELASINHKVTETNGRVTVLETRNMVKEEIRNQKGV